MVSLREYRSRLPNPPPPPENHQGLACFFVLGGSVGAADLLGMIVLPRSRVAMAEGFFHLADRWDVCGRKCTTRPTGGS